MTIFFHPTRPSRRVRGTASFTVAAGLFLLVSPATAFDPTQLGQGGSVLMGDFKALIDQSPQLRREVTEAAAKLNKKPEDILCGGMRFSGSWHHLGGFRVSPYVCGFGEDRFLEIRATVRITSASGKAFAKITRDAMRNASRIKETQPTWRWLSEDPRLKDRR